MEPQVGNILEGKVTTITKFGAFVALEGGRSGLVHISEIANTYVNDVRDYLQEGAECSGAGAAGGKAEKLNLSMKRVQPAPRPAAEARPAAKPAVRAGGPQQPLPPSGDKAFEDKLKHFLSTSEGKMADLHRSMDGKRGGRRRK